MALTDSTQINQTVDTIPVSYSPSISVKDNTIAMLRNRLTQLQEALIDTHPLRPILTIDGLNPLEKIADVQTQRNLILTEISQIQATLLAYESSVTDASKIAVTGDWSAIECLKMGYTYNYGMTSEWGQNHLDTYTRRLLALLAGIENDPLSTPTPYTTRTPDSYRAFEEQPKFIKNFNRKFYEMRMNNGQVARSTYSSSYYSYPTKLYSLRAIKNLNATTAKNLTFKLNATMYSSYGVAGAVVYTPNQNNSNRPGVTSVTYSCPYNNQSTGFTGFASITVPVPANTTILLMLFGADYYFYNNGYYYDTQRLLQTKDEDLILADTDIVQDNDLINNIAQSVQFGGKRQYTSIEQLWSLTPAYDQLDKLFNPQLLVVAANDTAAAAAGVALYDFYRLSDGTPKIRLV